MYGFSPSWMEKKEKKTIGLFIEMNKDIHFSGFFTQKEKKQKNVTNHFINSLFQSWMSSEISSRY